MHCRILFGIFFFFGFFSFPLQAQECGVPEVWSQISFLQGSWRVENSNLLEKWEGGGDDAMIGKVYAISGKDTMLQETVQLIFDQENIWYKATVSSQNTAKVNLYRLTKCNPGLFVFENPDIDFPQKIAYRQIGKDKLLVWVEGYQHGKFTKSEWAMRRVHR